MKLIDFFPNPIHCNKTATGFAPDDMDAEQMFLTDEEISTRATKISPPTFQTLPIVLTLSRLPSRAFPQQYRAQIH